MISVVIPALQSAHSLPATLACLSGRRLVREVIVVDGGSTDDTADLATKAGARVIRAPRGRGMQLAAGAAAATGEWLLFLHADTVLARGWSGEARAFIEDPGHARAAAVFRFVLDDDAPAAQRWARMVDWRTRRLGLPYGDQGLLISKAYYTELGGFRPMTLMEDVDMVRRIGRDRLVVLEADAVTSAVRYRKAGYLRRSLRNLVCLSLYFLGVPPERIERIYR